MLKSLSQSMKSKWRRVISGLLAAITVAGMLPATAFAAEGTSAALAASSINTPVYAPTGDFEVNIAGATGWNGTRLSLPVYNTESGGTQIAAVPASDGAKPIPFALLEYSGGDRVKVGLAVDDAGSVIGWEGGKIGKTGWVDKKYIFINLPDVMPSIAYNLTNCEGSIFQAVDGRNIPNVTGKQFYNSKQFSARLSRYEYVVPCMFTLAERLAKVQKSAMSNGETLVVYETFRPAGVQSAVRDGFSSLWDSDSEVSADMDKAIAMGYARSQGWFIANGTSNHQAGLAVDMSLAKGDPDQLFEYALDGAVYQKYEDWTEYDMPTQMHQLSSEAIRFQKPASSYAMPASLENWTEQFAASEGAKRLQGYCTAAGLIPLSSEWWHFNDPNVAEIMAKGSYAGQTAVNTKGDYTIDRAYSVIPYTTLTELCGRSIKRAPVMAASTNPTGGTGGLNPGSPGGQKPTTSNVDWTTDPERTFLRFTLIEFPEGVVKDIGNNDYTTWHVVGTPLNVVWGKGTYETWSAEQCRSKITWYNSCAMQYNGRGTNAPQMMAGGTGGVYSYDATSGYNQRWVTTADEFQKESGITDQQKEQMFHCNSSSWSTSWIDGDYTSMWGTDPKPVTPGNLYKVYKPNDAFLYLLGRLSENSSGNGWSKDDAIAKWSEYVHDASGNLRTKYRVIIETGGIFVDPDGYRRAYTLREMMAYTLYNSEPTTKGSLIRDQSSTIRNMAQWMRQAKDNQFLEYPLKADGTPTGEELHSTNGFTEADSFVDSITKAAKIRDTIFSERRSYGLHILSPFNFERPEPGRPSLEVTKKAGDSIPAGEKWDFTVTYTTGSPTSFTATKNGADCKSEVTETGSGLKFSLKGNETIRIVFEADASFRFEVREDDSSQLTSITGTGGTADMASKKFTSCGGESKVTFTNGTTITEKKPVYLKLKKIAAADKRPLSGAEFSVYSDPSCSGTPLAVMTTGSDGTASTSVPNIVEDGGSVTLYVKETKAPEGCTPLASPFTVTCKAPDNSTQAGAVQVGPASGIENGGIPEPGKALLFKRDALTNTGVGPATFKFSSVTNGVYEFDTDEAGVLESVQWWDPTESVGKYIKPGEYAVTELIPPPNYEPTTEVQQIKLELDADGNPIPAGPLVFKNLAKVGLKILKYDRQSHKPMANVTFEIFRDGVSLGNYETNANGEILLTGIEPGTYRAVEVDTGDDSHIKDTAPQEIELTAGCGIKELFFFNDVLPGMKLVKVDSADPSKTIPGVKFSIRAVDGSYGPQEFITDSRGEIDLSKLPTGSYVVTELECPGYVVDNAQRIIHLRANDTAEFVFTNTKKPSFRLIKRSADGTPLDGVTFKIAPIEDASHSIDRTTANGGEIFVEDLEPGIYSVVETATLPDHILDTTEYHVELSPGKTAELRLSNNKRPYLTIAKVEQGSNKPIPNTTFTVEGIDSDYRQDVTTGADGTATLQVDPGSYRITEKDVPEPYCLPEDEADRVQTVSLRPNDNKTISFKNSKKPLLTLYKIDADSQKPIPNTVLTVKALDGTYQDDWKTGPDGKVTAYVNPGVYEVTEKSVPSPYYLPDKDADRTKTITLSPGDEKVLTFRNRKSPELTIFKENSITGEPIEHAKFRVKYTSNGEAAEAPATIDYGEMFTDANGEIKLHEQGKRLYPGQFEITEVEPADGFQLKEPLTQTVIIHGNESKIVRFQNTPLSALVVWKYDSVTGAPVEGCIFQVKYMSGTSGSGGTVIGTYKTGPSGSFTINRLKAGAYLVEELASDSDHVMDTAPQTAYISGNEQDVVQLYFGNSPKGAILIKKIDASTHEPLSDCEFFITDSKGTMLGDANGKFTTDSAGTILISNLDPGTTIVARETRSRPNYILDDVPQTVTISAGRTATLEFRNQPKGSVTLYKRSSADRVTPLEGVGFKITFADGQVVDNIGGKLSSNGIYYTDAEGQINISGVTGTLIFTEISTIPGYLIDENRKSQTIVVDPDDHQSVYFYNQPIGSILVKKMSSTTKEPLSDVVIRITRTDGSVVGNSNGEFRTDENGFVKVDVEPGSYIVQEVKSKPGFLLDDTPKVVEVKGSGVYNIELFNQPLGSLVIHKYSSLDRKTPLAGVQFKVTYAPGCVVDDENGKVSSNGIYYTGPDGTITINGIVGTVVITEQATIPGYTIDPESRSQTIVVNPDDVQNAYFYNTPKNTLIIEKYLETESGNQPLKGVTFLVTDSSGAVIGNSNGEFISGDDGRVVIPGMEPGTTINVREIKVPDGVVLDSQTRSIKISEDGANILRLYNKKTGYLVIRKLDKISKEPLANVEFELTYADGSFVDDDYGHLSSKGRFKTNDMGEIRVPVVGTIVVKEVTPCPGYVIDETTKIQTVTVNPADTQTIVVYNEPLCSLTLTKLDAVTGKPVPNTEFTLKDGNGNILGKYTTGADGTVTVTGLIPNSTVVVVESKVPSNYVLDPTPRTIIVRNGGNSLSTGTTGGGNTNVGGNGNTGTGSGNGNNITVENVPKVTLTIEKYLATESGEQPLKGVTFLVTDQTGAVIGSSNGEFTTDENGRIVIPNLEPGTTITAREISVPDGVVLDSSPRSILIKAGEQGQTLRVVNKGTGYLVIKKLDKLTGKPLAGVEFKLTYASGEYVDDANGHLSSLGLYTTDANGEIRVPVVGTVVVEETKCLPGYTIDPGTQRQVVTVNPADTQTIKVYNTPGTNLTIQKYIEDPNTPGNGTEPLAGATFLITDSAGTPLGPNNGEYVTDKNGRILLTDLTPGTTITAKEIKVPSSEFVLDGTPQSILIKEGTEGQQLTFYNKRVGGLELIKVSESDKSQRIPNVTFEIRKMDGALVDTVTTDKTGRVHVDLDAGDFYAVEIECPSNFKLDSTPIYFTVEDNKCTTLTVTNAPFSGIILHKINSVTKEGIYDVKFLLYDQNKNPIGEYSTDDQGYIYIDDLTVQGKGKLFIRELEAAPGYELDKQYKTIYVQPGKTVEIEWENTPITGQFQIHKYAAEYNEVTGTPAGAPLQGAVYEISEARSGKVVDYITTDARGVAASKPLPLGRYKIVEVTAPAYWQVSGTVFDETLEYSGQIIKVSDYDKPSNLGVVITKRGNAEVLAGSSMRYDFTVANTSNVPLENFYWHDRIPTDAARATIFTTGTYSARLNYRILYKTNYSTAYQVLASNLITSSNYSFSLNAIPTQAGEYVTDVYLDFGKVPVGFQSTSNPTLTVTVSGTAANGYQLVNRADVGGKYQGTWQTAQATWITVIRKLTSNPTLPKTGY
ncbi:MAG: hypothetical protein HFF64_10765 [Oscillospiraceae bacterium]|nr:hypothetical protein [Oscillospiraceae bacterium]